MTVPLSLRERDRVRGKGAFGWPLAFAECRMALSLSSSQASSLAGSM